MGELSRDTLTLLATEALGAWPLEAQHLELHSHRENVVFKVVAADGETYALRIHRKGYHDLQALESEQLWTQALSAAGVSVPQAVANRAGSLYAAVPVPGSQDSRYVGLVRWIAGRTLEEDLEGDTSPSEIASVYQSLGELMARIHQASREWSAPVGFKRHAFDAAGLVGPAPFWGPFWEIEAATRSERLQLIHLRERLYETFASLVRDPSIYGMIHADLNANNVLRDGDALSVIDFDDAGFGWHGFDLAVALWDRIDAVSGHDQFEVAKDSLLKAYTSVRTDIDSGLVVELLPTFLLMRTLMVLGWAQARPETGYVELIPGFLKIALGQADELALLR